MDRQMLYKPTHPKINWYSGHANLVYTKNKSFLKKAPKQIVEKEKKVLIDCKIELKKLNSILNSIKN